MGFYPHIRNVIKVFRMDQKDRDWEEEFTELSELVEQPHEEEEDFILSGAGDLYELRPMTTNAFLWVFQNLKYEIFDFPSVICLKKDGMEKVVTTILEDGLNFSLTCHWL